MLKRTCLCVCLWNGDRDDWNDYVRRKVMKGGILKYINNVGIRKKKFRTQENQNNYEMTKN